MRVELPLVLMAVFALLGAATVPAFAHHAFGVEFGQNSEGQRTTPEKLSFY